MNKNIENLTKSLEYNQTLTEAVWNSVVSKINFKFADDYLEFMKEFNGGKGPLGENGYIQLWPFNELIEANQGYQVDNFAPSLFLIGSDGGGAAYGVRKSTGTFIEVPFIGMSDEDAEDLGERFVDFLFNLSNQD